MGKINESKAVCNEKAKSIENHSNLSCEKLLWNHILQNNSYKHWNNCVFKTSDNPLNEVDGSGEIHRVCELINPLMFEKVNKNTNVFCSNSLVKNDKKVDDAVVNETPKYRDEENSNTKLSKDKYKQVLNVSNSKLQLYCNKKISSVSKLKINSLTYVLKKFLRRRKSLKTTLAVKSSLNTCKHDALKKKHKNRRQNRLKSNKNKTLKSKLSLSSVNAEDYLCFDSFKENSFDFDRRCSKIDKKVSARKIKNKSYLENNVNFRKKQRNLDGKTSTISNNSYYKRLKNTAISSNLKANKQFLRPKTKKGLNGTPCNNQLCVVKVRDFPNKNFFMGSKSAFVPDVSQGVVFSCLNQKLSRKKRREKAKKLKNNETIGNHCATKRSESFSIPSITNITEQRSTDNSSIYLNWSNKDSNYPNPSSEGTFIKSATTYSDFNANNSTELNKRRYRNNRQTNLNKNFTDEMKITSYSSYLSKLNSPLSVETTENDSILGSHHLSNNFNKQETISSEETIYNSFCSSVNFENNTEQNGAIEKNTFENGKMQNKILSKTFDEETCENVEFEHVVKLYKAYHNENTNENECLSCMSLKMFEPYLEELYFNGFLCPKANKIIEASVNKPNQKVTKDKKCRSLKNGACFKENAVKTILADIEPVRIITAAKEKCSDVLQLCKNSLPLARVEKFVRNVIEEAVSQESVNQSETRKSCNVNRDSCHNKHSIDFITDVLGSYKKHHKASRNAVDKNEQITIENLYNRVTGVLDNQSSITDLRSSKNNKNCLIPNSIKINNLKNPSSLVNQLNEVYEELNSYKTESSKSLDCDSGLMQDQENIGMDGSIDKEVSLEKLDILSEQVVKLDCYENFLSNVEHFSSKSTDELQGILRSIKYLENKINQTLCKKRFQEKQVLNKIEEEETVQGSDTENPQFNQSENGGLRKIFSRLTTGKSEEVELTEIEFIIPFKDLNLDSLRHSTDIPDITSFRTNKSSLTKENVLNNVTCNEAKPVNKIDNSKMINRSHSISKTVTSDNFYSKKQSMFNNTGLKVEITRNNPKVDTTIKDQNEKQSRLPKSKNSTKVKKTLSTKLLISNDTTKDSDICEKIDNFPEFLNKLENDLIKQKKDDKLLVCKTNYNNSNFKKMTSSNVLKSNYTKLLLQLENNTINKFDGTKLSVSDANKGMGCTKIENNNLEKVEYANAKTSCAFKHEKQNEQNIFPLISKLKGFLLSKLENCNSKCEDTAFYKQSLKTKLEEFCSNIKHVDLKELSIVKKLNSYHDQIEKLVSESMNKTSFIDHKKNNEMEQKETPGTSNFYQNIYSNHSFTEARTANTFSNNLAPHSLSTKKTCCDPLLNKGLLKEICHSNNQNSKKRHKKTNVNFSDVKHSYIYFSNDDSFDDRFRWENNKSKENVSKFPTPSSGNCCKTGDHSNDDQILNIVNLALNKISEHSLTKFENIVNKKDLKSVMSNQAINKFQSKKESYNDEAIKMFENSQSDDISYNSPSEDSLFLPTKSFENSSSETSISISSQCKNVLSENTHSNFYPKSHYHQNSFKHFKQPEDSINFKDIVFDSIVELKEYLTISDKIDRKSSHFNNKSSKDIVQDKKYVSLILDCK